MMIQKCDLDKRICDVETNAANNQTYREYIRQSEGEFDLEFAPLDNLTAKELSDYLEFLDDLWLK